MIKSVADTSTLISLAKIHHLDLVKRLRQAVLVPEIVYEEAVVEGERRGSPDALMIKQLFQTGIFQQRKVRTRVSESLKARLGRMLASGDHAVVAIGLQEAAQEILTDDEGLGKVAVAVGFRVTASADLLIEALKQGELDWAGFETAMRGLVLENRISARLAELYIMEGARHAQR